TLAVGAAGVVLLIPHTFLVTGGDRLRSTCWIGNRQKAQHKGCRQKEAHINPSLCSRGCRILKRYCGSTCQPRVKWLTLAINARAADCRSAVLRLRMQCRTSTRKAFADNAKCRKGLDPMASRR